MHWSHRHFTALIGEQFDSLSLPIYALDAFEPSQIGTMVGALMDAMIPKTMAEKTGLRRAANEVGERECYPDYAWKYPYRVELKLLYVDNYELGMKRPPTPREPSARLSQQVSFKNIEPDNDLLLVIAYQLQRASDKSEAVNPTIYDVGTFSMVEVIRARDRRLLEAGGMWWGDYEAPLILSKQGRRKKQRGLQLDPSSFSQTGADAKDYNVDTNFGKLARIPYPPLQDFIRRRCGFSYG